MILKKLCFLGSLLVLPACGGSSEDGTSDDQSASRSGDPANMPSDEGMMGSTPDGSGEDGATEDDDVSDGDPGTGTDDEDDEPDPIDIDIPDENEPEMGTGDDEPEPADDDPGDPNPVDPTDPPSPNPCEGLMCGDVCDPTGGLSLLLAAPAPGSTHCNATGECVYGEVSCGPGRDDCTANCPVILICELCDDGETCAEPSVACNPDGSCGETTWHCPEDGTPEPADDEPPVDECRSSDDCAVTRIACALCEDGSAACPAYACVEGQCVLETPECGGEYDPCAGKAEGDSCSLCAPNDAGCSETAELKTCQSGECRSFMGAEK